MSEDYPHVIEAAGGVLWRGTGKDRRVAIVHRNRYDDWSLPKGKLEQGESWAEAALREVVEETYCQVRLLKFAGCIGYEVNRTPKVVLFWHMELDVEGRFQSNEETDEMVWLPVEDAMARLTYTGERSLLVESS